MKKWLLPPLLLLTSILLSQSKLDSLLLEYSYSTADSNKIKILHQLYGLYKYDSLEKAKNVVLQSIQMSEKANAIPLIVKSYNKYGEFLKLQSNYDSAISTYLKSIKIAKSGNFQIGISDAYGDLGNIYLLKGENKKALEFHEKNLKHSIEIKNDLGVARTYGNLGNVYNGMGEYTKAMEYYVLSSKKHEALGNIRDYAINLSNIGTIQLKLNNFESSKQYFKQSDSLFKQIEYQPGSAFVLYNLGRIYTETEEFDQAIAYSKMALKSYEQMGQKNQAGHISYTLGTIYWRQKRYREALDTFQKRIDIAFQIKDSANISLSYKAIGDCYLKLEQIETAKANYNMALEMALAIGNELRAMDAYNALSDMYGYEGDYKNAYENQKHYASLKDSLYTKEKRELAAEIEAKYQNERKVKEIAALSLEKDLQALQLEKRVNERNVIIALAFIILLIAGLLFNQFRIKKKANKKLQEIDALKSNFFANISHEFRTPLTLIRGPIEQLEQNPEEKLSMENIKMIRRNANRVLKMVNQLLDLAKIDQGNLKLERTEGDVYKCLRAAASSFNSHAAQRNMDYRVDIPHTILWASFDRDKLENIIYNLLGNAFKFSDDGSKISFIVEYLEYGLQIKVSDAGKGIAEDKLPFIFDRFFQVENSNTRDKGGSGIGLSLSKDLVHLMDGTITVSSEMGKGTLFTVQLPIQEIKTRQKKIVVNTPPLEKYVVKRPFALTKADKRNLPTILLVEDNSDMRHFITEQLAKFYRVQEAVNGEVGLQKAVDDPPDLIITDLMMPKMDGIELCKKLKTDVHTSHIPVIMLTAKAGMDNKLEGLETGADDYLTKPFDGKELLVRSKNLIEQRRKLRELFSNKGVTIDPKKVTVTSIDQKFLEQVLELLETNFSESGFGVPQMQESLAMSKTQLHRKLKALTNEAPGELLRNFRLKRAAQLLAQKEDNVTQIAYKVGFNNLSYFAKCFKELYGVAPSSY